MILQKEPNSRTNALPEAAPPAYGMVLQEIPVDNSAAPFTPTPLRLSSTDSETPNFLSPLDVVGASTEPSQCTNDLQIQASSDNITGVYLIDPRICIFPLVEPSGKQKKGPPKHKVTIGDNEDAVVLASGKAHPQPTALFCTTSGKIQIGVSVDISTEMARQVLGLRGTDTSSKARIQVRTKSGEIDFTLKAIKSGLHAHIDIKTNSSDATLYLPKTFRGIIHLRSKEGTITFLPAVSRLISIISANETDITVMMGDVPFIQLVGSSSAGNGHPQWDGDYASMYTRTGDLVVGIGGEDKKREDPTMWRRFSQALQTTVKKAVPEDTGKYRTP